MASRFAFEERPVFQQQPLVHDVGVDRAGGLERQQVCENLARDLAHDSHFLGFDRSFDHAAFRDNERESIHVAENGPIDDDGSRVIDAAFNRRGAWD